MEPIELGERVIACGVNPFRDGLRGTVVSVSDDGTLTVRWDDGTEDWYEAFALTREAESPDYPQPGPWAPDPPEGPPSTR